RHDSEDQLTHWIGHPGKTPHYGLYVVAQAADSLPSGGRQRLGSRLPEHVFEDIALQEDRDDELQSALGGYGDHQQQRARETDRRQQDERYPEAGSKWGATAQRIKKLS